MRRGNPQEPEITVCRHLSVARIYDPGSGRPDECIDCGHQLKEGDPWVSWHPDGEDVPNSLVGAVIVGCAMLVLLLGWLGYLASQTTNSGAPTPTDTRPVATPSTYGPPDGNRLTVPNTGSRPTPNPDVRSLPVVP